jgi:hypothetical protein
VGIRKNGAGSTFSRRRINFIEGSGVTLTVADDSGNEEVDVTIASTAANVVYRKTTTKTVNTTTSETDLLNAEITIAAGAMSTNKTARLTAWGDWKNNSGGEASAPRIKLKLGGTLLLDTNAQTANTLPNSASRYNWRIQAEIENLGATNAQISFLTLNALAALANQNIVAFATGEGAYYSLNVNGGYGDFIATGGNTGHAVDTTAACALELTVINGSNNVNCETRLLGALVEIV